MQLPKLENLVLNHQYFNGDFRDYSGNNNHGVPTGCHFQKKPDKHVIFEKDSADVITIADNPSIQLTEGTIFFYGDKGLYNPKASANMNVLSKRDAGGANYSVFMTAAQALIFYDGANQSNFGSYGVDDDSIKTTAISFVSGSKPKVYKNGAFFSDGNLVNTVTADDAPLLIGKYYGGSSSGLENPLKGVLIYNTVLTDEEIAQVHKWIMATKTAKYPKRNFVYPSQIPQGKDTKVVSAELIPNGDFALWTDPTIPDGWTKLGTENANNYVEESSGGCRIVSDGTLTGALVSGVASANKKYKMKYDVTDVTSGTAKWSSMSPEVVIDAVGSFEIEVTPSGASFPALTRNAACDITIDNVSLVEINETVASYDMKNVHGEVIDKTGNGNDGTITPNITQEKAFNGLSAQKLDGVAGKINFGSGSGVLETNNASFTVATLVKPFSAGSERAILSKQTSVGATGTGFGLSTTTPGAYTSYIYNGSGDRILAAAGTPSGGYDRLVYVFDAALSLGKTYLNGVRISSVSVVGFTAAPAQNLVAGVLSYTVGWQNDMAISETEVFNYAKSQAEVSADYNKYAKLPYFLDSLKDANESIAAEGGAIGDYLSDTGWKFGDASARYKVSRDETLEVGAKVIECTTAGLLYQESQQAYGTWEFDLMKGAAGNQPYVGFMLDEIEQIELTSGSGSGVGIGMNTSGFARVLFTEKLTGTANNKFYTNTNYVDASGTWYKFRITRRYDGQFTAYIKGGDFADWTLIDVAGGLGTNPITLATVTDSKYITLSMDATDKIANFRFTQGVITP